MDPQSLTVGQFRQWEWCHNEAAPWRLSVEAPSNIAVEIHDIFL